MKKRDIEDLGISITVAWGVVVFVVIVVIALLFLFTGYVRPQLLDMQRGGNQRSQGFVDTTVGRLFQLSRKYDDLDADIVRLSSDKENKQTIAGMVARQESLLDEMEQEAGSIPLGEVPEKIKDLLIKKGRLE